MKKLEKKIRTPVQFRSKKKKDRIIQVAYDLFSEKGYNGVSIRIITQKANVSIGTIYSYFQDKQDIYIAAAELYGLDMYNNFISIIEKERFSAGNVEDIVYSIIVTFKEIIQSHHKFHLDFIVQSLTDEKIRGIYAAQEHEIASSVSQLFIKLLGDKIEIRDEKAAIFLVHKVVEEIVQYMLFYDVDIPKESVFRELAFMVARYLEKKSPS